jgi:hypothetical protein
VGTQWFVQSTKTTPKYQEFTSLGTFDPAVIKNRKKSGDGIRRYPKIPQFDLLIILSYLEAWHKLCAHPTVTQYHPAPAFQSEVPTMKELSPWQ